MRRFIKSLVERTPYRIMRYHAANRFFATESCLLMMRARGYMPRLIIDGGAHLGDFSTAANGIFANARCHLIEPQPACADPLRELCTRQDFVFHPCALADSNGSVALTRTSEPSTGAHIVQSGEEAVSVPARTLDTLFGKLDPADRALLKLDLQGYELHALRGGTTMLRSVEVILTEVSFFAQAYEPSVASLVAFLAEHRFQLYDVASLGGRARDNRLQQGDWVFVRADSPLLADGSWA